jgi:hypothetical protein
MQIVIEMYVVGYYTNHLAWEITLQAHYVAEE